VNRPARTAVAGLFAATATPINASGDPDLATFDRLVDFLVGAGVDGIVVGGATAEYPQFDLEERRALIRREALRTLSIS